MRGDPQRGGLNGERFSDLHLKRRSLHRKRNTHEHTLGSKRCVLCIVFAFVVTSFLIIIFSPFSIFSLNLVCRCVGIRSLSYHLSELWLPEFSKLQPRLGHRLGHRLAQLLPDLTSTAVLGFRVSRLRHPTFGACSNPWRPSLSCRNRGMAQLGSAWHSLAQLEVGSRGMGAFRSGGPV